MLRFNTDTASFEGYDGAAWGEIAGGDTYANLTVTDTLSANNVVFTELKDTSGRTLVVKDADGTVLWGG